MSKSLRTLTPLARASIRYQHTIRRQHSLLRHQGPLNIQTVRFRRPPFSVKRSSIWAVRFLTSCYILHKLSQYILGEDEEDGTDASKDGKSQMAKNKMQAGKDQKGDDDEEGDENLLVELPDELPEDAIFIPLWWGTKRPDRYYKGSDPEWQSYVKFSHDKKKAHATRMALASHVKDTVEKNKSWANFLGAPVNIRRVWLDFDFPLGPPPEYDRLGIEIADDYIAINRRPQTDLQHQRVKNVLWPDSIAQSLWASLQMYCSLQYLRAKDLLDFKSSNRDGKGPPNPSSISSTNPPFDLENMTTKSPSRQGPRSTADLTGPDKPSSATTPSNSKPPPSQPSNTNSSISPLSDTTKLLTSLPTFSSTDNDLRSAITAFKKTLVRTWKPPRYIDRGVIALSGLVEVSGPKAIVVVDVYATYHPELNEMKIKLLSPRRMNRNKLSPRG